MKKTRKQLVYEAVVALHAQEQLATRVTLNEVLDLKMSAIDDCLKQLADDMLIYRINNGTYAPCTIHPPSRTIYTSLLPDGTVKVDIGDDVLTLTPTESRNLATLLFGFAHQYSNIELGHQVTQAYSSLATRVKMLEYTNFNSQDNETGSNQKTQVIRQKSY